jgi:hypothetical protein
MTKGKGYGKGRGLFYVLFQYVQANDENTKPSVTTQCQGRISIRDIPNKKQER